MHAGILWSMLCRVYSPAIQHSKRISIMLVKVLKGQHGLFEEKSEGISTPPPSRGKVGQDLFTMGNTNKV